MRRLMGLGLVAAMMPGLAMAGEAGDALARQLYAGTSADGIVVATEACASGDHEACFAQGLFSLVLAYEGLAEDFYRYGAMTPDMGALAIFIAMSGIEGDIKAPANPQPEPLSYEQLRAVMGDFLADLDQARAAFLLAGEGGDYVIRIDPLQVRVDFNGDGTADAAETLGALLAAAGNFIDLPAPDPVSAGKTKTKSGDTMIGFDRADALWFAGYTQIVGAPVDFLLAHDFSAFFDAYLHRAFPKSGLPMQDYGRGGTMMLDAESDASIADIFAALHTLSFPVIDSERLAGVRERMLEITSLSRRNWQLILAETDDERELLPSPRQTSLLAGHAVTEEVVAAWMETLDTVDRILAGELLLPHWRFKQGIDLRAYFETARQTDLVLLLTGQGALPFLKSGPVADEDSFAAGNRVFGDAWPNFILWFN